MLGVGPPVLSWACNSTWPAIAVVANVISALNDLNLCRKKMQRQLRLLPADIVAVTDWLLSTSLLQAFKMMRQQAAQRFGLNPGLLSSRWNSWRDQSMSVLDNTIWKRIFKCIKHLFYTSKSGSHPFFVFFFPIWKFREQITEARFKRRTLHVPNLMQMRKIYCFRSFALDSAHEKFDVWTGPDTRRIFSS